MADTSASEAQAPPAEMPEVHLPPRTRAACYFVTASSVQTSSQGERYGRDSNIVGVAGRPWRPPGRYLLRYGICCRAGGMAYTKYAAEGCSSNNIARSTDQREDSRCGPMYYIENAWAEIGVFMLFGSLSFSGVLAVALRHRRLFA